MIFFYSPNLYCDCFLFRITELLGLDNIFEIHVLHFFVLLLGLTVPPSLFDLKQDVTDVKVETVGHKEWRNALAAELRAPLLVVLLGYLVFRLFYAFVLILMRWIADITLLNRVVKAFLNKHFFVNSALVV